jgi:hypothetical protein
MDDYTPDSPTEVGSLSYVCLDPNSHNESNAVHAGGQPVRLDQEQLHSSRESRAPSLEDRTPTAFPTKGPRSFSIDMDYVSRPSKQQQGQNALRACLDEPVTRIDPEISDLDELLRKPRENAEARTQETSIDANITTTSELTPQATLNTDITGQVGRYHASEDEFIPTDNLFEEVRGNDDNDLVTNDLTVQDAHAADQACATTSSTVQIVTD